MYGDKSTINLLKELLESIENGGTVTIDRFGIQIPNAGFKFTLHVKEVSTTPPKPFCSAIPKSCDSVCDVQRLLEEADEKLVGKLTLQGMAQMLCDNDDSIEGKVRDRLAELRKDVERLEKKIHDAKDCLNHEAMGGFKLMCDGAFAILDREEK